MARSASHNALHSSSYSSCHAKILYGHSSFSLQFSSLMQRLFLHTYMYGRLECPNEDNPLTLHSLLPPPSHLPPDVRTSTMSLFSLSTEWCINYHYQVCIHCIIIHVYTCTCTCKLLSPSPHPYDARPTLTRWWGVLSLSGA